MLVKHWRGWARQFVREALSIEVAKILSTDLCMTVGSKNRAYAAALVAIPHSLVERLLAIHIIY